MNDGTQHAQTASERLGAIVLCGGKSTRMGTSKASLSFGNETMLQRVVRILGGVTAPVVVVLSADMESPGGLLSEGVIFARDRTADRGPLEGLAAGLAAIGDRANLVYATGCDAPLLEPAFVLEMARRLTLESRASAAVPVQEKFYHPLAAVYRTSILPIVERLLSADRLRPTFLFDEVSSVRVDVEELRTVDPELRTLWNLNQPKDYYAALRAARLATDASNE